uniref:Probable serine/threonine-protein kinase dyrk2 n=1 Tax=Phallusia mammillata TaxID=59560 RepID=A0A6F9DVY6_9ASCI|nr:probable serine/threonine-protein kinase dyrk2 [Phallusia mammillata]
MLEIPPWKAELLERKKAAKKKAEQIPGWKRELLKRLQNKAESAKHKMEEDEKQKGQTVLNEHIMKVSDNIFVRQERHRKMSASSNISTKSTTPSTPSPTKEFAPTGFHVIKKENIVIIEKDASVEGDGAEKTKEEDKEMPESGIVNRLKDKFVEDKHEKPGYVRAQSSDNVFDAVRQDSKPVDSENIVPVTSTSPYHRTYSVPTKPSTTQHAPKLAKTGKPKSLDFYTPRSFTPRHEIRHVSSPTKKVTAPVLQPKNTFEEAANQKSVDISSLHSSGSPKRQGAPKIAAKSKQVQAPVTNVGYSVDLHSSSREPSYDLPVSDVDHIQIMETQTGQEVNKLVNDASKAEDTVETTSPYKVKEYKPVTKTPSFDKENVPSEDIAPIAPPRSKTTSRGNSSYRSSAPMKSPATESSKVDVNQNQNEFKIIDLGRTSIDESQLKSKGAIAANEIMKNNKTIRIIPKAKSYNENSSVKPAVEIKNTSIEPTSDKTKSIPAKNDLAKETKIVETPPTVDVIKPAVTNSQPVPSKRVENNKTLPVSSVDDVIIKEVTSPKNNYVRSSVANGTVSKPQSAKSETTKVPAAEVKLKTAEVQPKNNFTVNKSTAPSVQDLLGSRRGGPRGKITGGNSFVFDPSKFKKSSAPSISSQTPKKSDAISLPNTIVIKPNQNSSNAGATVEDGNVQTKGKRKLTVDQIQVIGGYVKLEHCCLSKKRQKNVSTHVVFKQEKLESVYEYPSERSLLREDHELSMKPQSTLNKLPGSGKDSQLGKYTPKYLLSMKENLKVDDDDDSAEKPAVSTVNGLSDATPLDDAATFSSNDSSDILF